MLIGRQEVDKLTHRRVSKPERLEKGHPLVPPHERGILRVGYRASEELADQEVKRIGILERNARANSYSVQGILCDLELNAKSLRQTLV